MHHGLCATKGAHFLSFVKTKSFEDWSFLQGPSEKVIYFHIEMMRCLFQEKKIAYHVLKERSVAKHSFLCSNS